MEYTRVLREDFRFIGDVEGHLGGGEGGKGWGVSRWVDNRGKRCKDGIFSGDAEGKRKKRSRRV